MSKNAELSLLTIGNHHDNRLPIVNTASIDSYLCYVNSIPILTLEEEANYANKFFEEGDLQAAHCLVMAHLRYVVKVAKNYLGYGLPLADLIQEGTIGLMKAVRKFDCNKQVRLATFALHWIKAEIHEFILKNWKIVKIATTKAQRKLFFKLKSYKKNFNTLSELEVDRIASDLNVKNRDVKQMELRIFNNDKCFDDPEMLVNKGNAENSDQHLVPANYIEDYNYSPELALENTENSNLIAKLHNAISNLSPRHQDILKSRWLQDDNTFKLQDLAIKYGVSKERIRQLEWQAIVELRKSLGECC